MLSPIAPIVINRPEKGIFIHRVGLGKTFKKRRQGIHLWSSAGEIAVLFGAEEALAT